MMGSEIAYGKAGLRIRLLVALALALSTALFGAAGARAQETVPAHGAPRGAARPLPHDRRP